MKIKKNCIYCGKEIFQVKHSKGICPSCRTKKQWSSRPKHYDNLTKQKMFEKRKKTLLEKYPESFSHKLITCPCGKILDVNINSDKKYCSTKCQYKYSPIIWTEDRKNNLRKSIAKSISEGKWRGHNSGIGGIRKDLGIYFRSTFEANFARILKYSGIEFEFEQHHFKCSDGSIYIPDFYIPSKNTFIEIKGRLSDTKGIKKFKEISSKEKQYNWDFIGPNEYANLSNKYSDKIKNWETKQFNIRSENWKYE